MGSCPCGLKSQSAELKMRKLFLKNKHGQSLIEFALVLPILLLVLFGIAEFGRAIMVKNILHTASREGARLGVVLPVDENFEVQVFDRVQQVLGAASLEVAGDAITIQTPSEGDPSVRVTITYDFDLLTGGLFDAIVPERFFTLTGTTVMKYEGGFE